MNGLLGRYMRQVAKLVILCAAVFGIVSPASAGSAYTDELAEMSATLRTLVVRAERLQSRDVVGRSAILNELFELSKRLHVLEEEAGMANVTLQERGSAPDRDLLLAASVAKSLDLAQSLTGNYVMTRDKIFSNSAATAAQSARTMLAAGR